MELAAMELNSTVLTHGGLYCVLCGRHYLMAEDHCVICGGRLKPSQVVKKKQELQDVSLASAIMCDDSARVLRSGWSCSGWHVQVARPPSDINPGIQPP